MDLTDIALIVIAVAVVAFIVVRVVRILQGRGGCGCGCCESGAASHGPHSRSAADGPREVQLLVANMHCTRCESSVVAALSNIDGIVSVKPDHRSGHVTIRYRHAEALEAARTRLNEIGFTVQEPQA